MKKVNIVLWCVAVIGLYSHLSAQTTIQFQVNQPSEPLVVNAGENQGFDGIGTVVLGSEPTATGADGNYTYSWTPAEYLDDPNSPNPTVLSLDGPTFFTVIVTGDGSLCEKQDDVFVDYTVSVTDVSNFAIRLFPNPFNDFVQFKSELGISAIRIFDITGKILLNPDFGRLEFGRVETSKLNPGMYIFQVELNSGQTKTFKLCKGL